MDAGRITVDGGNTTDEGESSPAWGGQTSRTVAVASLTALAVVQVALWTTGVIVGIALVLGGPVLAQRAEGVAPQEVSTGPGDPLRGVPDTPEHVPVPADGEATAPGDDDVWGLDGFADFGDARMRVAGDPGDGWAESRVSGVTTWMDARCRLATEVVGIDEVDGDETPAGRGTDAEASERIARSLGRLALGDVETRSDPDPAIVRLPLADGGRAVELASVAQTPAATRDGQASFVVVSARASVEHERVVVLALACIDTPVSRADAMARDLAGRFRLDTSS